MATGDAISQLVVERTHKFDVVRNGRFLVFGVFIGVSNPAPFPYFSDFVTMLEQHLKFGGKKFLKKIEIVI